MGFNGITKGQLAKKKLANNRERIQYELLTMANSFKIFYKSNQKVKRVDLSD